MVLIIFSLAPCKVGVIHSFTNLIIISSGGKVSFSIHQHYKICILSEDYLTFLKMKNPVNTGVYGVFKVFDILKVEKMGTTKKYIFERLWDFPNDKN
jgi:hypothetical protein